MSVDNIYCKPDENDRYKMSENNSNMLQGFCASLTETVAWGAKSHFSHPFGHLKSLAPPVLSPEQQRWGEAKTALQRAVSQRPLKEKVLHDSIREARLAKLPRNDSNFEAAALLLNRITHVKRRLDTALHSYYTPPSQMAEVVSQCHELYISLIEVQGSLGRIHAEESMFDNELTRRFGGIVAGKIQASCASASCTPPARPVLPTDGIQTEHIENTLKALASSSGASGESLVRLLEPLSAMRSSCPTVALYLALANTCPCRVDLHSRREAMVLLEEYANSVSTSDMSIDVLLLLALARVTSEEDPREMAFRASCLRRCNVPYARELMTKEEIQVANTCQKDLLDFAKRR